jgi:hypothetical protein
MSPVELAHRRSRSDGRRPASRAGRVPHPVNPCRIRGAPVAPPGESGAAPVVVTCLRRGRARWASLARRALPLHQSKPGADFRSLLLVLVGLVGGCASGNGLSHRIGRVASAVVAAETHGAMRCAPRELAVARSHLEFAQLEEEQGFPSRARQHLDVAEENVEAASALSPPGRCTKDPP